MENKYTCLERQCYIAGKYNLVPIRMLDKNRIRVWRNDQMYHLRQQEKLTVEDQDLYFEKVVAKLFQQTHPDQILFSFLEDEECIGYGGLVHINWQTKSAEISFLMETAREPQEFSTLWSCFLLLIEKVAFEGLKFKRIFTFSYELRPRLYPILEAHQFVQQKRIPNALIYDQKRVDALVHVKLSDDMNFRKVTKEDKQQLFDWSNDPLTRQYSLNPEPISWDEHSNWFNQKLSDSFSEMYIFEIDKAIGVVRVEMQGGERFISFQVAPHARGQGLGYRFIETIGLLHIEHELYADVLEDNIASHKIFLANQYRVDGYYEHKGHQVTRYKSKYYEGI